MARPIKPGLLYFSLDVDIFDDDKMFELSNEFGPLGEVIYLRLLCLIYKNGYYYRFETLDKLAALIIRSIGNKWTRDKETVKKIIPFLAEINLLSSELMQKNVLTSKSIQKRYLKACERKQSTINEYMLIDNVDDFVSVSKTGINAPETRVIVTETPINVCSNPIKERKENINENEIKLNESKREENGKIRFAEFVTLTQKEYEELKQDYGEEDTSELIRLLNDYKGAKGTKYNNDYCAIKRWVCDKLIEEKAKKTKQINPGFVKKPPRYESKVDFDAEKALELSWNIIEQTLQENKME
ncbi:MAG: hypothetical protein K0S55_279 [Clostridia bacterium]|nr:hypothetical protein [Clostridia bacterium]